MPSLHINYRNKATQKHRLCLIDVKHVIKIFTAPQLYVKTKFCKGICGVMVCYNYI